MNSYRRGLRNGVLANLKLSILEKVNSVKLSQTWSNVLKKNLYYLVPVVTTYLPYFIFLDFFDVDSLIFFQFRSTLKKLDLDYTFVL